MTRILFLDLDGTMVGERALVLPLNHAACGLRQDDPPSVLDAQAVVALNRIVERSGARVVISSTWVVLGRERIEDLLTENGVAAQLHDDWQVEPLPNAERWFEICLWLDLHPEIREWVAVDDDRSVVRMRRSFRVTSPQGLRLDDVDGVVALLGEGPEPVKPMGAPRTGADYDERCRAIGARFPWTGVDVFGCPAGWLDLLEIGLAQAERRVPRDELDRLFLRRLDVWRGALRLDANDTSAAAMLWRVERRSAEICCACGEAGVPRTDRADWLTLCDRCAALDEDALVGRLYPRGPTR